MLKINLNSLNVLCNWSPVNQNIPFPSRSQFLSSDCNVLSSTSESNLQTTTLIYLHKSSSKNIPQIECYLNQSIIKLYMTIKPNNCCLVAGKIIFNLSCMTYLLAPASTRFEATMTKEAPRRNRDVCMSLWCWVTSHQCQVGSTFIPTDRHTDLITILLIYNQ